MMNQSSTKAAAQRGFADVGSTARAGAERHDRGDDLVDALAEIGLSEKTGWQASVVLYGTGGLATVALYLLRPNAIPIGVFYLALAALVGCVFSIFGARYLTNALWATHIRLCGGIAIFMVGAVVAGPSRIAFIMLPLFVLLTPSFLYGPKFALPYLGVVTALGATVFMMTPEYVSFAQAWVSLGAIAMIVVTFLVAEHTTRRFARLTRELANSDPLTGIANTRRLRSELTAALGRPFGDGQPFALFAIDLDDFKLVNDTYDHGMGDQVLCAVAEHLAAELEPGDLVARRGGDEYSVLVVRPEERDLDHLSQLFSEAIVRARSRTCPHITPSGSVAYVCSEPGDTISSVLQRADDALHGVKQRFHREHGDRDRRAQSFTSVARSVEPTALEKTSAAVDRAYASRGRGGFEDLSGTYERLRQFAVTLNPVWALTAAALIPGVASILFLTLAGKLHPLPTHVGLTVAGGFLGLALIGLWAAIRDWDTEVINLGFITAGGLMTWIIVAAGPAGAALVDLYPVLVLVAFYFVRPRYAVIYTIVFMTAYTVLSIDGGFAFGGLRAGITDTVVLVAAILILKIRSVTNTFSQQLARLSQIDVLTGLANMRQLRSGVDLAVKNAAVGSRNPVLLTIDLDRFKLVNDRYSHTVGDQMIESVARAISETVREHELVARRGGDEFFVLFDHGDDGHVHAVIERLHETIEHTRKRICPDLTPTASIAAISWEPGESPASFLHRADLILHDEKSDTRSRGYQSAYSPS